MTNMKRKAQLLLRRRQTFPDGSLLEAVIWRLPRADAMHPHGYKYRLYYGFPGRCLVRYDNEVGKGDHIHYGDVEQPYYFTSVDQLLEDFVSDVLKAKGGA